ncbi:MAG: septal ring lytic transglycosylase RlpA family protein [Terracidiphilus sp.]|jgi:rare lipoprotein A
MKRRPDSSNTKAKSQRLRFWLLAGTSSVALAAVVVAVSTRTVHADARLPRPGATAPPAAPLLSATSALTGPREQAAPARADLLRGLASWYGGVFNGRRTASGERFDMYAMTACHPSLPFGSTVRVVNLANQRSVVVRITDRGYLFKGRVIDLSYAAAQKLAMTKAGLAPVRLEVLSLGESHPKK